jgi:hypothetical protein
VTAVARWYWARIGHAASHCSIWTLPATQLLAFLVLPALLQASLGGFVASSAMICGRFFPPLAVLALQGLRRSVIWFVAFFAELVVLALLDPRLCRTRRRSRRAS